MKKQTEALKMANELLEDIDSMRASSVIKALKTCKEALEHQKVGDAESRQMINDIEYYQKRVEALEQSALDWMIKKKKLEHLKEQPAQEPVAWMYQTEDKNFKTSTLSVGYEPTFNEKIDNLLYDDFGIDIDEWLKYARAIEQTLHNKNE